MKDVLEKIKKLLRMKRGGTPAEIATALAMAQRLADRNGIDIEDVNPDETDKSRTIGHDDARAGTRPAYEQRLAVMILEGWFEVSVVFRLDNSMAARAEHGCTCRVTIVGDESARRIATYVYVFLVRAFRRAWRDRENKRLRNRTAFLHGMYIGILQNLPQRAAPGPSTETALQNSREAYLDALCPNRQTKSMKHPDSRSQATYTGYFTGLKTHIRSGVNGDETTGAILTGPRDRQVSSEPRQLEAGK